MATTFYATNNFTGDGTTVNWNINFADGYIDTTDVKARYLDNTGSYVDIAISSVAGNVVTISPAVANGQEFQIYRDTEKRFPLVDFSDGAILNENNLDTLATQSVMVSAEAFDQSNNGVRIAGDALVTATGIEAKAQEALDNSEDAVVTANGIAATANTALSNSQTAITTANAANNTANGIEATANQALANSTTAINTANNAVTTANAATATANGIDAKATLALSTAGSAVTIANNATASASTANTKADAAISTANGIEAKADSAIATANAATVTANSATTTANNASTTAGTALDVANSATALANTKASAGANSDITSLSGLSPNLTLRGTNSTESHGNGVVYVSNDPVEASFGIANIGGGAAVFHNYAKPANGGGIGTGVLIGGYGSRPWTGSTYTEHSNVSQHFLMDGTSSETNHGGWFRLLTTPLNATVDNRRQTFATSNNGDLYIGYDVPMGMYKLNSATYGGLDGLNGLGLKQVNNTRNEIALITPRNGSTAAMNFRGVAFNGTMAGTIGATQLGDNLWLSFAGHSGASFTGAAAGVRIQASSGWSTTNLQCGVTIATTGPGSTTRVDRWQFTSDGSFSPASDNVYAIGSSVARCTAIWATNGTIQTSDARMKTAVRPLTDAELSAASAIAKEIGFFRWLERVEVEGDAARVHAGITVQRVMAIMASYGLDPLHYGFVCHDVWEEESVFSPDPDDAAKSTVTVIPAGDRYSLRYTELSMFLARGMEQRLTTLEAQIAALTSP